MKAHMAHVDGLRAVAALFVVANHGFRMAWPNVPAVVAEQHPEGLMLLATGWMRYGHFAVTTFIAISGFCLMYPLTQNAKLDSFSPVRFYGRRAWRILPTYYAALGLSLLLIWTLLGEKSGTQWDSCLPVTAQGVVVRLVMLQDTFLVNQINNPFWSVATEFRIYLLMPVIVMLFRMFDPVRVAALLVVLVVGAQSLQLPFARHITFTYLCVFAMGCAAAFVAANDAKATARNVLRWIIGIVFAGVVLFLAMRSYADSLPYWRTLDYVVGAGVAMLLVYCSTFADSIVTRTLNTKGLVAIGAFSYSIYLMHFPFQALVWIYFIQPLGWGREAAFGVFAVLGTPAVLMLCWMFYRAFERPVLEHRPLWLDAAAAPPRAGSNDRISSSTLSTEVSLTHSIDAQPSDK